ncbi:hypothetical protein Nepgr_002273 [Nepenthes gracilis]|uniref:Glycosyltransferase n=1 Tax=Nepenthes gracilis TaxID=150966 RepID=A0AAD3P5Y5_NEPGR|nr:hypothetical protein Nepgr_002273 [Nepenthes gracilis]
MEETPHVAILPTPGMGHLLPLVAFAKRIVQCGFSGTFVIPTDGPPTKAQKEALAALPDAIGSVFLPPVSLNDLPEDAKVETIISLTLARSLPSLRRVLEDLKATKRLAALVVDLFGTDAFDVAWKLGVKPYIFFPTTANVLSLFLYLPKLDETVSCEFRELPQPVEIPGCIPLHGSELHHPLQDRRDDAYKWVLHHSKRYRFAEGIIANTFPELEGGATRALQEPEPGKPPVYFVGPLVRSASSDAGAGDECLRWLDDQPHGSVLFVSFGSAGTLSSEQLHELALGLEMSEQRFLWVVRSPNDRIPNGTYFTAESQRDPFRFMPEGFLDKTKGRGLVVPSWAPQIQVLGHRSTGGFLSHCGWNSTLESVVHGVPLITWPLFAEQEMNTAMLTRELKVGLKPTAEDGGLVGRAEIARVVRALMEGEEGKEARSRMKDLKDAAAKVLSDDGSSTIALSQVALQWKS